MESLITVKSKSVNNARVIVVYDTIKVMFAGKEEPRELSTSYVFENFAAEMPLEHADILVKNRPTEFYIVEDENYKELTKTKKLKADSINKVQEDYETWQKCPVCNRKDFKNKVGFLSHFRLKHPEEYKKYRAKKSK